MPTQVTLKSPKRVGIGHSLSKALILASNNPKNDDVLFIESPVQYVLCTSNCSDCQNENNLIYTTRMY